jgi:hypothetical protein
MFKQMKIGPELLSPSSESWLAYYLFVTLALLIPSLGAYCLGQSTLEPAAFWTVLMGLSILFLISVSMCMLCHFMGHMFDELKEIKEKNKPSQEAS